MKEEGREGKKEDGGKKGGKERGRENAYAMCAWLLISQLPT